MAARVEITTDTASPALKRLIAKLQGAGRAQMLGHMGEYMLRSTRDRAALEIDPDGRKWRPLEPGYARWKRKKRPGVPILKFDFHMLGDRLAYQVDDDGLLVGSSAPYAARHQFGGSSLHAAHSRKQAFAKNKPNGMKVFARAGSKDADHEKWVTVPEHTTTVPARPFLGVSTADAKELLDIAEEHISDALGAG